MIKRKDLNKRCTIVMYHYVRDMYKTPYPNIKGLLINKFIGQINFILQNYKLISLNDYIEFLGGEREIPQNSCILTFDDGFKDHYTNVFPILKRKYIPASFFPISEPINNSKVSPVHKVHFLLAKIGTKEFVSTFNEILKNNFPELMEKFFVNGKTKKERKYRWDDPLTANLKYNIAEMELKSKDKIVDNIFQRYFKNEREFSQELYLDWEEMREMIKNGMSFGGHSHTHPKLANLSAQEQMVELKLSKEILERNLKTKIELLSYPYGNFNETTIKILRGTGYKCAVTTDTGINEGKTINAFTLKRLDTNDLPCK